MKTRFLIVFLVAIGVISCKPERKDIQLSGQIDGYTSKPVWVYPANSVYVNKPYGAAVDSTFTNENGEFYLIVSNLKETFYHIFTENDFLLVETPIVAEKGDSVFFRTSIFNTSRPEFGGDKAEINQHLFTQRQQLPRELRGKNVNLWDEKKFTAFIDSIESSYSLRIDSLTKEHKLTESIENLMKAEAQLYLASERYKYLQQHLNESKGIRRYYLPNNEFYNFANELTQTHKYFWYLPAYSMTIDGMIEDDFLHLDKTASCPITQRFQIVNENYKGVSQEVALARLSRRFPEFLANPNFFNTLQSIDSLMNLITSQNALKKYFDINAQKVRTIKPGNIAPSIALPNVDNRIVSLDELRGKVVLVVFWGTWCPPCLSSIPKYIEIQERFKDEDVEFLFVSLEPRTPEVEEWKRFVQGKGSLAKEFLNGKPFPGTHVVALGQFSNPQVQPYAVTFAPSYVLIDKEGRIVMPRASLNEDLIEKIKKILKK